MTQNFLQKIEHNAAKYPDNVAISYNNETITYKNLFIKMQHVAVNCGFNSDDNIMFACQPDVESLTLALGILLAGAKLTILDPFSSDELFINRATAAKVTCVIGDGLLYHISAHRKLASKVLKKPIANLQGLDVPNLVLGKYKRLKNVRAWFTETGGSLNKHASDLPQDAIIVFTSGTTSDPKGVVHTLQSLSANIEDFSTLFKLSAGGKVYSVPMTLGLIALSAGATWVIPGKEKNIPDCDVWFGTPVEILEGLPKTVNSKIKVIGSGAAPILPSLVKEIEKYHPSADVLCVYGMTEMLPIAVGDAKKKIGFTGGDYIGLPLPKSVVKIVDGEVFVGGPGLMKNYVGHPETQMLATGDFGELLDTGELVLLGRKKNMFIRGDMNIYPGLYEPAVASIPGVNECVLLGVPDKYGDDELILIVSPLPSTNKEQLKNLVERNMHNFFDAKAIPSTVVVMDVIPKSGRADKIDREATLQLFLQTRDGK